jgi:hypothetical protein
MISVPALPFIPVHELTLVSFAFTPAASAAMLSFAVMHSLVWPQTHDR